MLDIGLGEVIVIAILALLVFGPDRLPKVAADAARALRNVREMATAARRELSDAAGLQEDDGLAKTVRDLRDLDPRRVLSGEGSGAAGAAGTAKDGVAAGPAGGSAKAAGSAGGSATADGTVAASGATDVGTAGTVQGPDLSAQGEQPSPTDPPTHQAPPVDPDWT